MIGTKILEERTSKFNKEIKVLKSLGFGTYIQVNGLTQSGGIVETIWKETLRSLGKIDLGYCLILGLGGGTVAKLIRKKWPKSKLYGIEIDPVMVEMGRKYLNLDESKVKIIIGDAFGSAYLKEKYDLVIVDVYQGDTYPTNFESEVFIKSLLKNKIVIFNRLYYRDKRSSAVKFATKLERYFENVDYFYPQANLMLICSKEEITRARIGT